MICPRCAGEAEQDYYGPCARCRGELVTNAAAAAAERRRDTPGGTAADDAGRALQGQERAIGS